MTWSKFKWKDSWPNKETRWDFGGWESTPNKNGVFPTTWCCYFVGFSTFFWGDSFGPTFTKCGVRRCFASRIPSTKWRSVTVRCNSSLKGGGRKKIEDHRVKRHFWLENPPTSGTCFLNKPSISIFLSQKNDLINNEFRESFLSHPKSGWCLVIAWIYREDPEQSFHP